MVNYAPRGAVKEELAQLEAEYEQLREAARRNVCQAAGAFRLASARLMMDRNLENLLGFEYIKYCDGSWGVSPGLDVSVIWTDAPEPAIDAL